MTREEITNKALSYYNNNSNLLLELATGVGKTKISLDCVLKDKIFNPKLLILVAERAHINNWKKEIVKWGYTLNNISIICYASLKNLTDNYYDVIICDEVHNLSQERILNLKKVLNNNPKIRFIGLSATISWDLKTVLRNTINNLKFITYGMKEAIKNNVLPTPEIILVPLDLSVRDKYTIEVRKEINESNRGGEVRKVVLSGFKDLNEYIKKEKVKLKKEDYKPALYVEESEVEIYKYINERVEAYTQLAETGRMPVMVSLREGLRRKTFLGDIKTNHLKTLLNKLKNKRIIGFTSNINQCNEVGKEYALHSKSTNKNLLEDFNNKKINRIFTVKMLREGVNLVDTKVGIITQLDGTTAIFIQKLGRLLRHKKPVIYILYYRNTQDEKYLDKAMSTIDKKYVKTKRLSQIK